MRMLSLFGNNDRFKGCFREALGPFLLFGQFFGLLPVVGVNTPSLFSLRFKWSSFRAIYASILSFIYLAYTMSTVWNGFFSDITLFDAVASFSFYATNTFSFIFFVALALKWPDLMFFWENAAAKLPTFHNIRQKTRFVIEIRCLAFTILFMGLIEHILFLIPLIQHIMTHRSDNGPISHIVQFLTGNSTKANDFEMWDIACDRLVGLVATVVWNYVDVFIMLVSIALSTHFKLFNAEIKRSKFDNMTPEFWAYRRIQYDRLCSLVATVDKHISHIILLSFMNNLHVTCKQLYQCFKPFTTAIRAAYLWYSLFILILRTFMISIYAAYINDESKKPLTILRAVPASAWCAETKRFYNDVTSNITALSGMKFFYLNRKLILSVSATIVTYELVLIQIRAN